MENCQWTVARHPETVLDPAHFELRESPIPKLADGKLRVVADEIEGFEQMPQALMGMFTGTSGGKRFVKVVPGPIAVY